LGGRPIRAAPKISGEITNEKSADKHRKCRPLARQFDLIRTTNGEKLSVTVATTILDQDGDGKLDQEDLKQLTQKGLSLAKSAATEVARVTSEAAKSDLAKDSAAAAVVGAAIAVPVPLIGPAAGAAIGAALGAYKKRYAAKHSAD
jgi:hypothetical protein